MSQQKNPYQPQKAVIDKVIDETPGIKTFVVKPENGFEFHCGQFAELTIPGIGEAPFAMSSPCYKPEILEFTIQDVGYMTSQLHEMKEGDVIGVRGPYGNGFPLGIAGLDEINGFKHRGFDGAVCIDQLNPRTEYAVPVPQPPGVNVAAVEQNMGQTREIFGTETVSTEPVENIRLTNKMADMTVMEPPGQFRVGDRDGHVHGYPPTLQPGNTD